MVTTASKREYPNPKLKSTQEEAAYWKEHSPLLEGYEGEVNKEPTRRTSFLSVRMSGREIELLRQMAAREGIGPTTFARRILLERVHMRQPSRDELKKKFQELETRLNTLEKAIATRPTKQNG